MAGLYIHIPYCTKLCYYCDFHFSLNLKTKGAYVSALCTEILLKRELFSGVVINTIYFGGGTPSVLTAGEIRTILSAIYENYTIAELPEITLECNPDDMSQEYCNELRACGINRLSIGIQSFDDAELRVLNRRHSGREGISAIHRAQESGFENITIDLMYGIPDQSMDSWKKNVEIVANLPVQHLSAYALMLEEKTALHTLVQRGKIHLPDDSHTVAQFEYLMMQAPQLGFEQYEISNFARNKQYSQHNSNYWNGIPYLGFGASAHSYLNNTRFWNITHNAKYIEALSKNTIPQEIEKLSTQDCYNEYIMTRLRTMQGVEKRYIQNSFPEAYFRTFTAQIKTLVTEHLVEENNSHIRLTTKGIMLSDSIIRTLFVI
ncbi:MAG: radical SAM family heme chaperone HemW [Bacteroidota bacterium]